MTKFWVLFFLGIMFMTMALAEPTGFSQSNLLPLATLSAGSGAINPPSGTVAQGKEFTIEIAVNPQVLNIPLGQARFNNYEFSLQYDPSLLRVVSAENQVPGLVVDKEENAGNAFSFAASMPFGAFYYNQPTTIARIIFLPLSAGTTQLTLGNFRIVNSYGEGGTSASFITTTSPSSISIVLDSECVPSCSGKACGSNGCGGSCGNCAEGQQCQNGACGCVQYCIGKECGANGCGGSCGTCASGFTCRDNGVSAACVSGESGIIPIIPLPEQEKIKLEKLEEPPTGERGISARNIIFITLGLVFILLAILTLFLLFRRKNNPLSIQGSPPKEW